MLGKDARIRVSSSTLPSLMGTLKSTRMRTRLPARSRSRMDNLGISRCTLCFVLCALFGLESGLLTLGRSVTNQNKVLSTKYKVQNHAITKNHLESFGGDVFDQIPDAAGITPLIVVPGKHLQQVTV